MLLLATPGYAAETLQQGSLKSLCASDKPVELESCRNYVRGFIDGALSTDPSVAHGVVRESSQLDRLTERAMRTRVQSRLQRYGPSFYAGFCLPQNWEVDELAQALVDNAISNDGAQPARDILLETVRREFPCNVAAATPN